MQLSRRIGLAQPSRTAHFAALVSNMRAQGKSVLNLAIGEPHEPTGEGIITATRNALAKGQTRYSTTSGLADLRGAIAGPLPHHTADNILITNGSKQALFSIFQVICNPGDEVIIPRPCWVSFPEQVKLAGGKPVLVETRNHQLDLAAIAGAVGPRTRAILINSPNNPTGAVYPERDLEEIGNLVLANDLFLISDEAYAHFVYDDGIFNSLAAFKELKERAIITGSFSKSYNMTGFRVGYAIAPTAVTRALAALQSHLSGNVCTFAQYGALAALREPEALGRQRLACLKKNRDHAFKSVRELFDCIKPAGAFYLFPDVSGILKKGETSEDLAIKLLTEAGVAVMPGESFGAAGHIRIAFAVSNETLLEAFERMRNVL